MNWKEYGRKGSFYNTFITPTFTCCGGGGLRQASKSVTQDIRHRCRDLNREPNKRVASGKQFSAHEVTQHKNSFCLISSKTIRFTEHVYVCFICAASFGSVNNQPFRLARWHRHIQLFIKCPLFCPVSTKIGMS
jgi:hypothetical protein